jgi:GNAT superfamily N-acetyltransferase
MGETPMVREERIGYCIGNDQYFKRDDVGIIYALNVLPGLQRKLIGATLIKAMFERAAWGCKLFCCWCAQDIAANYFWESIGFVPIAFRAGSRGKGRVHIFWQKRIREGDTTTAYWYPCETKGGAIREDRLVLPIPPGTYWKDAKPMVLPGAGVSEIEGPQVSRVCLPRAKKITGETPVVQKNVPANVGGGLHFAAIKPKQQEKAKVKRECKPKVKNDPRYVAAARELRDRWMEEVSSGRVLVESQGKYDVVGALPDQSRQASQSHSERSVPALPLVA